jgi:predicted site-specific integrase-resolvase
MKIQLTEWGARNYSPSPTIGTLRAWASTGQIVPPPEKVGRLLMVDENAVRVPLPDVSEAGKMSDRALHIFKAA